MSYRQLFDEAIGEPPPSRVNLDRVIRRQRRAARLRPTVAGVALVAIAAATAMFVTRGDEGPALVPADDFAGFPEYLYGTRVVAAESAEMADRTLTLTFTLTSPDQVLMTRCETVPRSPGETAQRDLSRLDYSYQDLGGDLHAEVSVGEVSGEWPFCLGTLLGDWGDDWRGFWAATGAQVGEEVTITVRLTRVVQEAVGGELPVPDEGRFALGVGQPVPFEEYVFPSPPEVLHPLPEIGSSDVGLQADPDNPNAPVERTFVWDEQLTSCEGRNVPPLQVTAHTPGILRVLFDGVEVAHHTFWDYEGGRAYRLTPVCAELTDGEQVTIRVEPEHMTGDWRVFLDRG